MPGKDSLDKLKYLVVFDDSTSMIDEYDVCVGWKRKSMSRRREGMLLLLVEIVLDGGDGG